GGDLELPRQGQVEGIEEEVLVDHEAVGRDVEGFGRRRAGVRAGGHVPDAVRAGSPRRDADLEQPVVHVDDPVDGDPVELDVLPGRDVGNPSPIAVGDVGHALELPGREDAARDLDPLHVARVVELVVQAV